MNYKIYPVGIFKRDGKPRVEIFDEYKDALYGLSNFNRILLLLWFHKSDGDRRKILKVHSHGEPGYPVRGVFATRSPVRPNPVALYNVKIYRIEGLTIEIEDIDAYDGTPVIDIKPFVKDLDCP
ncbi:putative methyltransferase, YaeB/AF_0241 family [Aciduliprofundum sp. MAR08-339]|uniref:tRNA (N6-threonylcarbamoyladenosine(37)-N6)-methyltransferase TrmO n=1 Tax=Aciduliprofundum sp. (strain MAR08-339) TaxID=673860 RepID=UPI0002A4B23C|nr:putative methyltransferase, YaeB/AF_0241 family [Aciduliprofundum sp. MAR08-339]